MHITFLGAADSVTGSKHLIDTGHSKILLDCGLFQGYKQLRERNWAPLPIPAKEIDAVVLSHAHLDHSGYLPALVKQGFRGAIHATPATCDLAELMLLDSAHLQEEDARYANAHGFSKHKPALPLYTTRDAQRALTHFKPRPFGQPLALDAHTTLEFTPAGHLLGAACVTLRTGGRTIVFSGDLGRDHDLLMAPPERIAQADVLLLESTYGDRVHPADDPLQQLADVISTTVERGGSVLLPTFAVGRAQALMLAIHRLKQAGRIPQKIPVYLDSPMAAEASRLYARHRDLLRIDRQEVREMYEGVTIVATPLESAEVTRSHYPSLILSASGMATGGRVLHHLKAMAPHAKHHVVFPGFQVPGSRGAKLVAGAREVKIHGEYVPVRAQVSHIEGFSGHADANELMRWLGGFQHAPQQVFVVHGEPSASDALRSRIQEELHWNVHVPEHRSTAKV
nr:MBL fold metallo-hydrolase [uncultured Caldimonas sp.]